MGQPRISLIVPTLNEAENLPRLLARIDAALAGRDYEVLIVDDNSRDNTAQVCTELQRQYPLQLLVRDQPHNGLSGAVLHGMAHAVGEYLVVMDADLQHPPERLPEILEPLEKNEADFVIGSRYVPGGRMARTWGWGRRLLSRAATLLATPIVGNVRDPMSGFFALKRQSYLQATHLTPLGYKIALEMLCKCPVPRVREVPIFFDVRAHGESKLTFKEQFRYVEHLSRLYDFCYPRAVPIAKFLVALACSWAAAGAAFALLAWIGWDLLNATAAAYPLALAVTALFHLRYTRTQREFLVSRHPWGDFALIAAAEWIACATAAAWLVGRLLQPHPLEIFLLSFGTAAILRYVLRKELLLDIRGLRQDLRKEELL
jgi:dolichol-phosphate mannosyltransferase